MAQALNTDDVQESQPLTTTSPNSESPGTNPNDNTNTSTTTSTSEPEQPSTFSQAANTIKESTISASKKMSEISKQRLSMEGQLYQARVSLERYVNPKILNTQINEDTLIPKWVLKRAKGLVFLTVVKAGFLFAGNVGTGCVIIRRPNGGWTGPSSVGVAGVSIGFLVGASKVDHIMVLPDDKAVKQFTGKGQLRLGGEIQLAVGPIGRDGSGSVGAGDQGVSVVYSYSHAQGLYGGLALDGKVIRVRQDCNKSFYKKSITCSEILNGNIDPIPSNEDYEMIIHLLDSYCLDDDMTPISGEKLSIDELNNNKNNNEEKKEINEPDGMVQKVSSGFTRFTSSVSQKWLALTTTEETHEEVKLQRGDNKDEKKMLVNNNENVQGNNVGVMEKNNKNNNKNYNDANYQIGGDELIANVNDEDDDDDIVDEQTQK